jgi:hypothetical protein
LGHCLACFPFSSVAIPSIAASDGSAAAVAANADVASAPAVAADAAITAC